MRVVLFTPNWPPLAGGISRLSVDLVEALRGSGIEVHCIAASSERGSAPSHFAVPIQGRSRVGSITGTIELIVRSLVSTALTKPDVVVGVTWRVVAPVALIPRRFRPPIVVLALGSELIRGGRMVAFSRAMTFAAAERVIAISQATASVLLEQRAVAVERIAIISPGVWPVRSMVYPSTSQPATDGFTVLSVGRLDLRKGHDTLIDAFAILHSAGATCTLRIVGEGADRQLIEDRIHQRRLGRVVKLLGNLSDDDVAAEYGRADAFALLTRDSPEGFEGFGIVFIEAAQRGLPILAGSSGGSVEAVDPGMNAELVTTPAQAAEVLQRWMDDPLERQRLRDGSLKWARRFDWSILAELYVTILREACKRASPEIPRSTMPKGRGRISTAMGGEPAFLEFLYQVLPDGLILNLGAGKAPASASQQVIFVDHVSGDASEQPWVLADINQLPFRDRAVPAVVLKDVLEHLPDPIGVLSEIRRVTQPGGRLAIVTPRAVPRAVWSDPTHIRGFTERALRTALEMAGWTIYRRPRRVGRLPGAGRYAFLAYLMPKLMAVPGLGHWLGTNWLVVAEAP